MSIDDFLTDLYDFVPAVAAASWAAARTAGLCFAVYFAIAMLLAPSWLGHQLRLGDVGLILMSGLFWWVIVSIIGNALDDTSNICRWRNSSSTAAQFKAALKMGLWRRRLRDRRTALDDAVASSTARTSRIWNVVGSRRYRWPGRVLWRESVCASHAKVS